MYRYRVFNILVLVETDETRANESTERVALSTRRHELKLKIMSQRIKNIDEDILINLQVKVTINSFSNHNGFKEGQVSKAITEFKDEIVKHLNNKLANDYQMEEFLYSVDFVNYEVDSNGL